MTDGTDDAARTGPGGRQPAAVHAILDYWDGPIRGVADFSGCPHFFERIVDETGDDYASEYWLSPLEPSAMALVLESWAIWRRWAAAFHEGRTTRETHPALPPDRLRHEEIEPVLKTHLRTRVDVATRAHGEFQRAADPSRAAMFDGWTVEWTPSTGHGDRPH